jgi:hypothetical protein
MVWGLKAPTKERLHYSGRHVVSLKKVWLKSPPLEKDLIEEWKAYNSLVMAWGLRAPH